MNSEGWRVDASIGGWRERSTRMMMMNFFAIIENRFIVWIRRAKDKWRMGILSLRRPRRSARTNNRITNSHLTSSKIVLARNTHILQFKSSAASTRSSSSSPSTVRHSRLKAKSCQVREHSRLYECAFLPESRKPDSSTCLRYVVYRYTIRAMLKHESESSPRAAIG